MPAWYPAIAPAWPPRLVSSYCTNDNCNVGDVGGALDCLNGVSITSYYLALDGTFAPCSSNVSTCQWRDRPVGEANQVRSRIGAHVQPLVFSNSGTTVDGLRALVQRTGGLALAADYLRSQAVQFGYRRVQLDLEPSCWASNATDCTWPGRADARSYVQLIDAVAQSLASVNAEVSVAVGAWPPGAG